MANRLPWFLPLLAALAACSSPKAVATGEDKQQAAAEKLRIPLSDPVLIDSSDYVMYPLSLGEIETKDEDGYSSYSSYSRTSTYWNMLFYNPRNRQSHLLGTQKMLIQSYTGQEVGTAAARAGKGAPHAYAVDQLLFFSITTVDFNHDGQLTTDDPTYLFTSTKNGENFRQISPDSLHVTGWEIQRTTGKILMQTLQDSNHNRKFGEGDEGIPYEYTIATQQPARRIFSPTFMNQLRTRFQQQWPPKP